MEQYPAFSAEQSLAALCGRVYLQSDQNAESVLAQAVSRVDDWQVCLELIRFHRLDILAANVMLPIPALAIPDAVREVLRRRALDETARAMILVQMLQELADAFAGAGVSYVALKGPALAQRAYGNVSFRPCRDLDILVDPRLVRVCHDILSTLGYVRFVPEGEVQERLPDFDQVLRLDKHLVYVRDNIPLELHWRLDTSENRFPARIIREMLLKPGFETIGGKRIVVLAHEWRALYLAFHGAKHAWQQWLWLLDVDALWKQYTSDERLLTIRAARRLKLLRTWQTSRVLASRVFGGEAIDPSLSASASVWIQQRFFEHHQNHEPTELTGNEAFRWSWHLREDFLSRLLLLTRYLFLPKPADLAWLRLPRFAMPLYVILRPLRLLLSAAFSRRQ